jgi:hypothetical protein
LVAQGADEHGKDGGAGRRATDAANDDCNIKRNRAPMEMRQLGG